MRSKSKTWVSQFNLLAWSSTLGIYKLWNTVFWQATTPQVMEDPQVPDSFLGSSISMTPWRTWPCSMDSLWQAKAQTSSTKTWVSWHTFVYVLLLFVWFFYSLNFISFQKLYFNSFVIVVYFSLKNMCQRLGWSIILL